jgi:hypothetical protein
MREIRPSGLMRGEEHLTMLLSYSTGDVIVTRPAIDRIRAVAARKNVVAHPADQGVIAKAAMKAVISGAAIDEIGVIVASEQVIESGANDVFDPAIAIECGVAPIAARRKTHVDRGR